MPNIERAARSLGLAVASVPLRLDDVDGLVPPALAVVNWGWGQENHAIAVLDIAEGRVLIHDPNVAWERWLSLPALMDVLQADLLVVSRPDKLQEKPLDATWPPAPRRVDVS
ncbi:MAG: hypothetical protein JO250_21810 [Armatimonadetes bacterium]|nr:hypothetical protein [Armatimonadota bacterium]